MNNEPLRPDPDRLLEQTVQRIFPAPSLPILISIAFFYSNIVTQLEVKRFLELKFRKA